MAVDRIFAGAETTLFLPTTPTAVLSGGPCVCGKIPGVALKDAVSGYATMQTDGVFDLSVKDTATGGITAGDILYFDNTTTPKVNNTNTGVRFGYALEAVSNGGTDTINVKIGY